MKIERYCVFVKEIIKLKIRKRKRFQLINFKYKPIFIQSHKSKKEAIIVAKLVAKIFLIEERRQKFKSKVNDYSVYVVPLISRRRKYNGKYFKVLNFGKYIYKREL